MLATSSASDRGKPSRSSSAIVADMASGYHDLQIDSRLLDATSVPHGESVLSCAFTVGGHTWRMMCYPNGSRSAAGGYVSMFLRLDEEVAKPVPAQVEFSVMAEKRALFLVRSKKKKVPSTKKEFVTTSDFASRRHNVGYPNFAKREDLLKMVRRQDDPLTIRCHIVVFNGHRAVQQFPKQQAAASAVHVPPSNLHTHLGDLLSSKRGADVVFEVGGETYPAHRCVLAARSPVFAVELFSSMRESDAAAGGVVHIDDMEPQVFQALLHFAYTDTLPEMRTPEEGVLCQHLLVAADRYDMERLKLICEDKLCRYIDVGTAAIVLTLAEQHRCHCLKKACIDFISAPANLKAVVASDGFEHLSSSCPSITKDLLAMHAS
ncbi:BTB/POZ and MATH domain-containing protein 1 [Sorghum bicolor]|uniref:BTB domain-containing protein n=2 Tax=Sorghum bicolor TaxID=4558 RepID=A0A1B6QKS6_SORBI|nr:BTB/POZ and MATH domain-containing protein 1 [Sorghum bicolor]KXG38518.1 hypothetical protein SORBI_3001G246800 [Sorghum bicolor]|eukprot:XP_002464611.2 BTB/POZ and MATH domain-containing protein 1 [Sorghum bicolor]